MKTSTRERLRINRKGRVKKHVQRNKEKLRLTVFRSAKHVYAQIVDDKAGKTLVAESILRNHSLALVFQKVYNIVVFFFI